MQTTRRLILGAAAAALTLGLGPQAAHAQADNYPNRPITVIIPFGAGSASTVVSRVMLDVMSQDLGQPIIVDNRPGAGGNAGTAQGLRAAPDGYTLIGGGSGPIAANATLFKNLGYDPIKDLEIISPYASFTIIVTASKKLGVNSVKELIALAKKQPGKLHYGSVGIGSSQHLAGEYFQQVAGVKLEHVPYKNIAQYGPDLIAGTVPLGFQWYPNVAPSIEGKGAIPLAVASDKRLDIVKNAPTTAEAGLPDYKVNGWFALVAPAGTPRPILEKLNLSLNKALKHPKVQKHFASQGAQAVGMGLDEAKKFQIDELEKFRQIIEKAGIPQI